MKKYFDPELNTISFDVEDRVNSDFGDGDGGDIDWGDLDPESPAEGFKFFFRW